MNSLDSLTAFFYNIVPGSLFVLFLGRYEVTLPFLNTEGTNILMILIYGLFFGFVFQGLTKIFRGIIMNRLVFLIIISKRKTIYKQAISLLKPITSSIDDSQLAFYLMDNYLRAKNQANAIAHFTARLAFWSNIFFASSTLLLILILNQTYSDLLWLIGASGFSLYFFYEYLKILYDSVLQSFVTVRLLKN